MGRVGIHPGSFRKSGKQRGYGIRNLEEDTEDGRWTDRRVEAEKEREMGAREGTQELGSRIHELKYHEIVILSITI